MPAGEASVGPSQPGQVSALPPNNTLLDSMPCSLGKDWVDDAASNDHCDSLVTARDQAQALLGATLWANVPQEYMSRFVDWCMEGCTLTYDQIGDLRLFVEYRNWGLVDGMLAGEIY